MSGRVSNSGFTLVEILIVILVLLISAAVVIPSIGTAADSQVTSAARVLACDLETVRSLALTTQVPHTVLFSPDLRSYKVVTNYAGGSYALATAIDHPVRATDPFVVTLAQQNGMSRVTLTQVNFGGHAYVTFDSQGQASDSGFITLAAGSFQMQVSVEALTGVVSVSELNP